jgi:hypothetical protein
MSQIPSEYLQDLIESTDEEYGGFNEEDIRRIYSCYFEEFEPMPNEKRAEMAFSMSISTMFGHCRGRPPSDWDWRDTSPSEERKEKGGILKQSLNIDSLTEISRCILICTGNGCKHIRVRSGSNVMNEISCRSCERYLWIEPHPEEAPDGYYEDLDEGKYKEGNRKMLLERFEDSKGFLADEDDD